MARFILWGALVLPPGPQGDPAGCWQAAGRGNYAVIVTRLDRDTWHTAWWTNSGTPRRWTQTTVGWIRRRNDGRYEEEYWYVPFSSVTGGTVVWDVRGDVAAAGANKLERIAP